MNDLSFSLAATGACRENFYFSAVQRSISMDGVRTSNPLLTAGRGLTKTQSLVGAFGEYFERSALCLNPEKIVIRYDQLTNKSKFRLPLWRPFHPTQTVPKNFCDYDKEYENLNVVPVLNITDGVMEYAPSELYYFTTPHEKFYPSIDTTGCAAGPTLSDTALRALFEILEKNSLIVMWLTKRVNAEIKINTAPSGVLAHLLHVASKLNLSPRFFDISAFSKVKTVLCIANTNQDEPHYSIGAATRFTFEEACMSALSEAIQVRIAYRHLDLIGNNALEGSYRHHFLARNNKLCFERDYYFCQSELPVQHLNSEPAPTETYITNLCKRMIDEIGHVFLHIYKSQSARPFQCVKVIAPDLLWRMLPVSEILPWNRCKLISLIGNCPPEQTAPIPFP